MAILERKTCAFHGFHYNEPLKHIRFHLYNQVPTVHAAVATVSLKQPQRLKVNVIAIKKICV